MAGLAKGDAGVVGRDGALVVCPLRHRDQREAPTANLALEIKLARGGRRPDAR
jgi:hypothetical protein